jgi:uncharacterized protein YecE (DUF72 family)
MGRYGAVTIKIGTAGWSIPREIAGEFPAAGSSLERYAARFSVAEINSSFHRPHRRSTWERWRDSVPPAFRFSVKLPKAITHQHKLVGSAQALDAFIEQARVLEEKLAVLLVQLPPKLAFDEAVAASFFAELRARTPAQIACEPRHPSWFAPAPDALLAELGVARVAADPAVCEEAAAPAGWKPLYAAARLPRYVPFELWRPDRGLCGAAEARSRWRPRRVVHLRQHRFVGGDRRCARLDQQL